MFLRLSALRFQLVLFILSHFKHPSSNKLSLTRFSDNLEVFLGTSYVISLVTQCNSVVHNFQYRLVSTTGFELYSRPEILLNWH